MLHKPRLILLGLLEILLIIGIAADPAAAQPVQIQGGLGNFDVRYLPNAAGQYPTDIEIFLYGDGLKPEHVTSTWNTNNLLGNPPAGLEWGTGTVEELGPNTDPNSPAFGLDCIVVKYEGPPRPNLDGRMVHLGVRLDRCVNVLHQEVRWTFQGDPNVFPRPCDPHITWICTTRHIIICVQNPTPDPFYVYGCRWFPVPQTTPLPLLSDLTIGIDPDRFGQQWNPIPLPGAGRTFCIPAWCRIYLRIPVTTWRPIVFQMAARNVDEEQLPLPTGTDGPNPDDIEGQLGTMAIITTRPVEVFPSDLNCDGSVDALDLRRVFAPEFGLVSDDIPRPPDPQEPIQ